MLVVLDLIDLLFIYFFLQKNKVIFLNALFIRKVRVPLWIGHVTHLIKGNLKLRLHSLYEVSIYEPKKKINFFCLIF